MPISIYFNGIDRAQSCKFQNLTVLNSVGTAADTADIAVALPVGSTWRPMAGNDVFVQNGTGNEFSGIMMDVTETMKGGAWLEYKVTARDYTFLFDRNLVAETYPPQAAADIIRSLVVSFTSGFSTVVTDGANFPKLGGGPTVGKTVFDYIPPSQACRELADTVGWVFYIGYDKTVNFFDPLGGGVGTAAPTTLINLDTNIVNYGDMELTENSAHVKDRVYIKGFKQKTTGTYNNQFAGDGTTKFFLLGYQPASSSSITVTRNGIVQNYNTDNVDGQPQAPVGGANDYFVCFDNLGIRWDVPPSSNDTVVATYNYLVDSVVVMESTVAESTMAARENTGDGVHEFAYHDPALTSADGSDSRAQGKGNQLLSRYAFPRLLGKFQSFTQGWRAGQIFTMTSVKRMGGFTKTMYVTQVTKRLVNHPSGGSPLIRYDVEISDNVLPL